MNVTRRVILVSALAAATGSGLATRSYVATVGTARRRIDSGGSRIVASARFGAIEYATAGTGKPLMMIHGTGGGFDQGLRFGHALTQRGFQVVAPSRFGYLGSPMPMQATPALQADALAELLDHLGIDRLPVAGGSAGALSAAEFAIRHPDRCSALILLVPAANLTGQDPVEFTPLQKALMGRLLKSDLWFWAALRLAPKQLIGTLLATDPALLDVVSQDEAARAKLILSDIMPISRRAEGTAFDGYHAGHPATFDVSRVSAPTLVISAEDDNFGTATTARLIGERLPSARMVIYPSGGHIWLGHDQDVASEIAAFLRR
jgi:2-hydroxy-6-oxonona-2,4-dienedioate hydrolase